MESDLFTPVIMDYCPGACVEPCDRCPWRNPFDHVKPKKVPMRLVAHIAVKGDPSDMVTIRTCDKCGKSKFNWAKETAGLGLKAAHRTLLNLRLFGLGEEEVAFQE